MQQIIMQLVLRIVQYLVVELAASDNLMKGLLFVIVRSNKHLDILPVNVAYNSGFDFWCQNLVHYYRKSFMCFLAVNFFVATLSLKP
jgi:hypothetical protein